MLTNEVEKTTCRLKGAKAVVVLQLKWKSSGLRNQSYLRNCEKQEAALRHPANGRGAVCPARKALKAFDAAQLGQF